ncbi:hypothetical protein OG21DRAFT_1482737 [Imleria badia]|nr:hypothetical protein OG21DRAFT_1482737 [Imleria badia]
MQELADAIGIARETILAFNPDDLSVREKLRLASTRNATVEEDVAYSLTGIFKSDIRPHYGEGEAALGHLLEEIVARSGDVTVLVWTGKSSPYNNCLPATLAVYSQSLWDVGQSIIIARVANCFPPLEPPLMATFPAAAILLFTKCSLHRQDKKTQCDALLEKDHSLVAEEPIEDAKMDARVAALRNSLPRADAMLIHDHVTRLPPARFANRRLHLPSLSRPEPRKLILVHPWIRDLRDPLDGFTWNSVLDSDESESDPDSSPSSPSYTLPVAKMDDYTRALRLVVRLRQPFHALLLQQQPNGEFKRVAAEHGLIVPGHERQIDLSRDIHVDVVEVL